MINLPQKTILAAAIAAAALLSAAPSALSQTVKDYRSEPCSQAGAGASNSMQLTVDSVDWRADLTRVYARIQGRPHTSNRIDSMWIEIPGAAPMLMKDIDGVDRGRWFQWEDDGAIAIEIDFAPVQTPASIFELRMVTPRGKCEHRISRP